MRFFHGDSISNSVISLSPRVTARLIADCPTPRSLHALHGFENTPAAGTAQQASAGQFRSSKGSGNGGAVASETGGTRAWQ